jgi:hypothetical protein
MILNQKRKADDNDINLDSLIKIFFLTFSIILFGAIAYFIFYVTPSPLKPSEIGQIGDFYGGLLNPFLTFFTIVFLIWSIRLQSKELAATREELIATREEIKQTAKSHKELVTQGNASFFIEQAIRAFDESEDKAARILQSGYSISDRGGSKTISIFDPDDKGNGWIALKELYNERNNLSWDGINKKNIQHSKHSENKIKELFQLTKNELINVNVLIENHGWSLALTCLLAVSKNIEVLRCISLSKNDEKNIIDLLQNATRAIDEDILNISTENNQFATTFLLNEVSFTLLALCDKAKEDPFDD